MPNGFDTRSVTLFTVPPREWRWKNDASLDDVDTALHPDGLVGFTDVQLRAGGVEGVLVGNARLVRRFATPEGGVRVGDAGDVVAAALAGPLPDDRRAGADPDRCGIEGDVVAAGADVDRHLAAAGLVVEGAVVVVGLREVVLDGLGNVTAPVAVAVARTPGQHADRYRRTCTRDETSSAEVPHTSHRRGRPSITVVGSTVSLFKIKTEIKSNKNGSIKRLIKRGNSYQF